MGGGDVLVASKTTRISMVLQLLRSTGSKSDGEGYGFVHNTLAKSPNSQPVQATIRSEHRADAYIRNRVELLFVKVTMANSHIEEA
ncbi:hypothetical protein AAVH_35398 [Aphelenchoides avenae]|nr:hypothetical protein AAVH_35398 [Aphelenchus avenae]